MGTELDRIKNALRRQTDDEAALPAPLSPFGGFFHFRYSRTEISVRSGDAYVKRHETRFENGRLVTEECEGMVDGRACQRAVDEMQRHMLEQMTQMMRLFFLPFGVKRRDEE